MEYPQLINFINVYSGVLDFIKISTSLLEYDDKRRQRKELCTASKNKRPFSPRKTYRRRDPMTSFSWIDYVIDSEHSWCDETHRNGKLFCHRFSHSFNSVVEIVAKIQEDEHYFW